MLRQVIGWMTGWKSVPVKCPSNDITAKWRLISIEALLNVTVSNVWMPPQMELATRMAWKLASWHLSKRATRHPSNLANNYLAELSSFHGWQFENCTRWPLAEGAVGLAWPDVGQTEIFL